MNIAALITLGGYLAAGVLVARIAYIHFDRDDPDDDGNGSAATCFGLIWPLALTVLALSWLWQHSIGRETPRQRRERLAREAETLRVEAGKLGLPMPYPADPGPAKDDS